MKILINAIRTTFTLAGIAAVLVLCTILYAVDAILGQNEQIWKMVWFTILPVLRINNRVSFDALGDFTFMAKQIVQSFLAFLISFMLVAILTDSGRNLMCYFKTWDEDRCFGEWKQNLTSRFHSLRIIGIAGSNASSKSFLCTWPMD